MTDTAPNNNAKPDEEATDPRNDAAPTLPSRDINSRPDSLPRTTIKRMIETIAQAGSTPVTVPPEASAAKDTTPWILQQFFNGEIDLDVELSQRFQHMPVMATVNFREMGGKSQRGVATLATQDGSAQVIIDADSTTRTTQMSFTYGSMLTLRFAMHDQSDMDRKRWLDLMRRPEGGLAFLWGPSRWESDYLICIVRRYFTNLYAFSPNSFEAAVRMTPGVTKELLNWFDKFWQPDSKPKDQPPTMLTW